MSHPGEVEMFLEGQGVGMALRHGPSGSTLETQPPADNFGTGARFSPTDLLAVSLGACAVTTMAISAAKDGVPFARTAARVVKRMVGPPRRVGEVVVEITMPAGFPAGLRARYEEIAHGCPVARSLHPDVRATLAFRYP